MCIVLGMTAGYIQYCTVPIKTFLIWSGQLVSTYECVEFQELALCLIQILEQDFVRNSVGVDGPL